MPAKVSAFKVPKHIADDYYKLKSTSSEMQRAASSIGLIQQALFHQVTPTFAKVKGQFLRNKDKYNSEKQFCYQT